MDNIFILNPSADKSNLKDAIDERLNKAKAITQCLLACNIEETEFLLRSYIYDVVWVLDDYLREVSFLQNRLAHNKGE